MDGTSHGSNAASWLAWAPGAFVATAVTCSAIGTIGLLLMTRWGIGTSPDSVGYLQAARAIGVSGTSAVLESGTNAALALSHFAPLYSFLLSGGAIVGLDAYEWARWLNALLFGANVLVVGAMLRAVLGGSAGWLGIVGIVLALAASPLLTVHVTILSEPVFILLTFLGLYLLSSSLDTSDRSRLLLAALAIGLAWLARYAGVACVMTGVLAVLMFGRGGPGRRVLDATLFAVVSSAGMLAWMARNSVVSSSATGREVLFHPFGTSHMWQALYTASSWLMIPASAPDWVRFGAWFALGAMAAGVLVAMRSAWVRKSDGAAIQTLPTLVKLLALFVAVYSTFLVVSISFFDANTQLDSRILSPVYVAGVVLAMWVASGLQGALRSRPALARLMAGGLVAFTGVQVVEGARLGVASHNLGWGFSSRSWQASPTLDQVRRLPEDVRIYSNAPEPIYLNTGREASGLPRRWSPMNQRPNPDFPVQMAALERVVSQEPAVVVYFTSIRGASFASDEQDLTAALPLRIRDRQSDGVILCGSRCPE
jgi:hypothetical protein